MALCVGKKKEINPQEKAEEHKNEETSMLHFLPIDQTLFCPINISLPGMQWAAMKSLLTGSA